MPRFTTKTLYITRGLCKINFFVDFFVVID